MVPERRGICLNEANLDFIRLAAYPALDAEAIGDIRLALNQGQPQGDSRFIDSIERVTGQRRGAGRESRLPRSQSRKRSCRWKSEPLFPDCPGLSVICSVASHRCRPPHFPPP